MEKDMLFYNAMSILYNNVDEHSNHKPLIHQSLWDIIQHKRVILEHFIVYERDYLFDYIGFETLERSYLMHVNGKLIESPQHMFMRVSLGIHGNDLKSVKETYDLISQNFFTHDSYNNADNISLTNFVKKDKTFDYELLHSVTKIFTTNLNKIIDKTAVVDKTKIDNLLHRPIEIGIQGLEIAFDLMNIDYNSDVVKDIYETIYHAALERSNELAKERSYDMLFLKKYKDEIFEPCKENYNSYSSSRNYIKHEDIFINILINRLKPIPNEIENLYSEHSGAYSTFTNSPLSQGILQFDIYKPTEKKALNRYDWNILKDDIKKYGVRNSVLIRT